MAEPPVQADSDGAAATPRKTGHQALDLVIAGAAILISLISLAVAWENSRIQQRILAASTWPLVQFMHGNNPTGDTGALPTITLWLRNSGLGPARIESVSMKWRGKPVTSQVQFLEDCCGARPAADGRVGNGLQVDSVSPSVLPPGDAARFLVLPQTPDDKALWSALDKERFNVSLQICYCSVLDQCWLTDGIDIHPPRVKQCPRGAPPFAQ